MSTKRLEAFSDGVFATIWMGENISYPLPIAVLGVLQLAWAIAYFIVAAMWIVPDCRIVKRIGASATH